MTITAGPEALAARHDTTDTVAAALHTVPREHFLPARIWVQETDDGPYEPIDRATEPQRWMHDVYVADHAIVTQFDDGATQWPDRGWRLGTGTGTGYSAALLAELVGSRGHVLSVDVDGQLVSTARRNLAAAGYQDRLEVGLTDGATALAAARSVDRVIATAAVQLGRHGVAWLLDPITGSWASVVPTTPRSDNYLARQAGPRRLWDEAAAAYPWWDQHAKPGIEDWQWTITPHRQRISLA